MTKFPSSSYSNREVRRAGELIAKSLPWRPDTEAEIREAFLVANSWRDSHAFPMSSVRQHCVHYIREAGIDGKGYARVKRMPAIKRKLLKLNMSLNQLQDLGGCRFVMSNMDGVKQLAAQLKSNSRYDFRKEDDYVSAPKADGYRSHHVILGFRPADSSQQSFAGRRIEVQVRTRLQHCWATAVETVGLFRNEELKYHKGSAEWLRLFSLVSGEFAVMEGCPPPEGTGKSQTERVSEIRHLSGELGAIPMLDSIRLGVRGTDNPLSEGFKPSHFLLRFHRKRKEVTVEPYDVFIDAAKSYGRAEEAENYLGNEDEDIVLVEVDKIESLQSAFPNYFGDVEFFNKQLRLIVSGKAAEEFAEKPQVSLIRRAARELGDWSWLRKNRFARREAKVR